NFTVAFGTFNANNQDMTVAGNWSNGGTVQNTATVTFNGPTGTTRTLNSGGSTFNSVVHSGAGTVQLTANALTVNATLDNTAGTFEANGLNMSITGLTTIGTAAIQNSVDSPSLTFNGGLKFTGGG